MSKEVITRCPKCRGTSGYQYTETFLHGSEWGLLPGPMGAGPHKVSKSVSCIDCGYRMSYDKACGNTSN